ncbi:MAG TPA: M20/M25/M40 family metallo-hydrolase [Polyangiaceae bacterium]
MPETARPTGARAPAAEAVDATRVAARRLAGDILVGGQAMKTLAELTDAFGPRLTGSEVHRKAAAWAVERFRASGVDATLEPFTLDHAWVRGEASGTIVAPREAALHVAAIGWTPATPAGGVRGEVIELDDVTPEAIARRKGEVKGKIAYYDRAAGRKAGWHAHSMQRLTEAGAVAVLIHAGKASNSVATTSCSGLAGAACTGSGFVVGLEDGATIERLLEKGTVTVTLSSSAALSGPIEVPNVVAEIKGREKPDEAVLVGAHLDSWDLATGAQDNGSGAAQVLEVARAIRALGTPPRRTMRFLLWAGEEEGLYGSRAYVKAHAAELDRVVAYLNTDHGAGVPVGWDADGRDDIVLAMKPVARSLLSGLNADALQTAMHCDTDHCPFWVQGVPAFNLDVDDSAYDQIHHLSSDTVDKVKPGSLAAGAAVLAITAYALAELPDRIAPRADHAAIARQLKGADVLADLVDTGMWKP